MSRDRNLNLRMENLTQNKLCFQASDFNQWLALPPSLIFPMQSRNTINLKTKPRVFKEHDPILTMIKVGKMVMPCNQPILVKGTIKIFLILIIPIYRLFTIDIREELI